MINYYFEIRKKFLKSKDKNIIIDKQPLDEVYAAEIFTFFPNAKFIFPIRNPNDVILSCFIQQFQPNNAVANFLNFKDTAIMYDLVQSLWNKYIDLLPIKYHVIKYESIITSFDETIRNLLNFLNLKWSDSVKNFDNTAKQKGLINTPSYDQVTLPLYKTSIERWKNYEEKYKEINDLMIKWMNKYNYNL